MKILASTATLVGGGIVAPIYFVAASVTPTRLTRLVAELSKEKPYTPEVEKKVSCTSFDVEVLSTSPASKEFLQEQGKNLSLYSYVTCSNSAEPSNERSLLREHFEGLFPKDVLTSIFSPTGVTGSFEMSFKSDQWRNVVTTFNNASKKSSINARWSEVVETDKFTETNVVKALIEGGSYKSNEIYLLIDLVPKTPVDTTTQII